MAAEGRTKKEEGKVVSLGIRIAAKGVVGIILIVTAVAAGMLLDPRASQAYERPWRALTEIAGGAMYERATAASAFRTRAGSPPGRRHGSRAASESASTTEGTLSHAGSPLGSERPILQGPAVVGSRLRARPLARSSYLDAAGPRGAL